MRVRDPFALTSGNLDRRTVMTPSTAHPVRLLLFLPICFCIPLHAPAAGTVGANPSVILISIDTLRADHLSAYGYTKLRTPHIDTYAQGGTLFTQAEAQVPLTLPSHTSLFTSTYPFQNGVEENGERVPAGVVTLASVLHARGYKTAAFIGCDFMDRRYGLDKGFDVYDSPFGLQVGGVVNPLAQSLRRDGALVARAARQWLDDHRAQPVLVFVHLYDLHFPYTLPAELARQQGISRYDAQLQYVDQVMGRFHQYLLQSGWWENSLVVVFGDHGEGLGDHRETDHGYYIYESTLRVPLIFHWPHAGQIRNSKLETRNSGTAPEARAAMIPAGSSDRRSSIDFRVSCSVPVGLIDVAPTILDYLRVAAPPSFVGQSQLGALEGGEPVQPRPVFSESLYAYDAFGWSPLRALRVGKYKYIQAPKAELYNLDDDPRELVNLVPMNAAMTAELQEQLAKVLTRYASSQRSTPPSLSPETLAELESLGYLAAEGRAGSAPATLGGSLPDPKDRFGEFELYQSAYIALMEGHIAAALPTFQSILKSDPQNTLARFHLGECYRQIKQAPDALREWETVLKLNPQYAPAAEAIGQYWMERGDYAKARRRFQQVLALTPESYTGQFQLALADERLGLLPEARRHYEEACKIAPHDENCARKLNSLPGN